MHDLPFGGLHYIAFGDFAQHQPPSGRALFFGASNPNYCNDLHPLVASRSKFTDSKTHPSNSAGRKLWVAFKESIILKQQHRFGNDDDGQALYDIVYKLTHARHSDGRPLTDDDIAQLADTLNNRAIAGSDLTHFLKRSPKAVVLRHSIRPTLTRLLVLHHGAAANSRVCSWRAIDTAYTGKRGSAATISSTVLQLLESQADNDTPPAIQYFYPGIPYRFLTSEYPAIGWFHNGACIGEELVLDEREPDDTMSGSFRVLKFPPKALFVRLPDRKLGKLCGDGVPEGCVPVAPKNSKITTVTLPFPVKLYGDKNDATVGNSISFKRHSFPVDTALAFTDYYAQGVSFRGDPHFLHLSVSQREGYRRANLLVPISRPAVLSDVILLHPLWPPGDQAARHRIVRKFKTALQPDEDYDAEMVRLHDNYNTTISKHYQRLMNDTSQGKTIM